MFCCANYVEFKCYKMLVLNHEGTLGPIIKAQDFHLWKFFRRKLCFKYAWIIWGGGLFRAKSLCQIQLFNFHWVLGYSIIIPHFKQDKPVTSFTQISLPKPRLERGFQKAVHECDGLALFTGPGAVPPPSCCHHRRVRGLAHNAGGLATCVLSRPWHP